MFHHKFPVSNKKNNNCKKFKKLLKTRKLDHVWTQVLIFGQFFSVQFLQFQQLLYARHVAMNWCLNLYYDAHEWWCYITKLGGKKKKKTTYKLPSPIFPLKKWVLLHWENLDHLLLHALPLKTSSMISRGHQIQEAIPAHGQEQSPPHGQEQSPPT